VDGLRAVAILPVIFYHAYLGFPGGYVGVDVFFVISGYLISGIILNDLEKGRFSMLNFWERRIRRIAPALTVVLLATIAACWLLFLPTDFQEFGQSLVAQATLVSNGYFWLKSGYFDAPAEGRPLLHTWSLAVEEQFYLLFPLILAAAYRYMRWLLVPSIVNFLMVSFLLSVYCTRPHPAANFYLLPTRAWELLLGALLATHSFPLPSARWLNELLSGVGLAAIACAVFLFDRTTPFPGIAALAPCMGAGMIIWTNTNTATWVGRLLALPPVVFIGLISYSLYLWHWPLLVISRYWILNDPSMIQRIWPIAASFVLSIFSWQLVETPVRTRKILGNRRQVFAFACMSMAGTLLIGLVVNNTGGMPWRIPEAARKFADAARQTQGVDVTIADATRGRFPELGNGDVHQPIGLVLWGDSHAMAVRSAVDALCRKYSVRGVQATRAATAPLVDYVDPNKPKMDETAVQFNNAVLTFVRNRKVKTVLLVGKWKYYDDGSDRLLNGLRTTIRQIRGAGAQVWIMKMVPKQEWNVPKALAGASIFGGNPEEMGISLTKHREASRHEDKIFDAIESPGVKVLDPTNFLVIHGNLCRVAKDGESLYVDNHHLSVVGALLLQPMFQPLFTSSAKDVR
jgi:peptidoglycan/LPS O-acetylase OafA/YrhL